MSFRWRCLPGEWDANLGTKVEQYAQIFYFG